MYAGKMARPLRIQFSGALYHVVSRGNERRGIVRDDKDRERRVEWLQRTVEKHGWRLHAFVLLPAREHLFFETPQANLSTGMHFLNGSYTGYFNRRHKRSGHLFEGRFKGHLIEGSGYYLQVSRYIHRLPLQARLTKRVEDYSWSSFPGYRRAKHALDWVCYDTVLGELQVGANRARRAYARFVCDADDQRCASPFVDAVGDFVLGSSDFVERIRRLIEATSEDSAVPQRQHFRRRPSLAQIVKVVAQHFGADPGAWRVGTRHNDQSRAIAAYLARRDYLYGAKEIAEVLGYRSHGSVRSAVLRLEKSDNRYRTDLKKLRSLLT